MPPNEDPLGKRITIAMRPPLTPTEIIGVVSDVKHSHLEKAVEPMSYWPIAQLPYTSMSIVIRTRGEATAVATAVRNAIQSLDPQQPISDVRTLESLVGNSIARQRFNTLLLLVFAVVALLLAGLGIYGVMSYSVTARAHEIGVRIALGATAIDILRLTMKRGMALTLLGVGFGLAAALALTRLMATLLYGVGATDPLTFISVALLLAGVALLACWVPARRATKVDPMVALRCD